MKRTLTGLTLLGLLALAGCGDDSMPDESTRGDRKADGGVRSVRLHIDGFKKSKSGAT